MPTRSSTRSSSPRRAPRTAIAQLVAQDNRTKYLVYAHEGTGRHDRFLNAVFRRLPNAGLTRAQIRTVVQQEGGGRYRLHYNSIVVDRAASARRKLF